MLKNTDLKKNLYIFELSSKRNIILVSIKKDLKISDIEKLGAEFFGRINIGDSKDYFIISDTINNKNNNFLSHFLHGAKLKSYVFKKYKTKKEKRDITLNITGNKNKPSIKDQIKLFKKKNKQAYREHSFIYKRKI